MRGRSLERGRSPRSPPAPPPPTPRAQLCLSEAPAEHQRGGSGRSPAAPAEPAASPPRRDCSRHGPAHGTCALPGPAAPPCPGEPEEREATAAPPEPRMAQREPRMAQRGGRAAAAAGAGRREPPRWAPAVTAPPSRQPLLPARTRGSRFPALRDTERARPRPVTRSPGDTDAPEAAAGSGDRPARTRGAAANSGAAG